MSVPVPTPSAVAVALRRLLAPVGAGDASLVPPGIVAVYLFGSVARGNATAQSDIDVGLLYAEAPAGTLAAQPFALEAALAELLGYPVQCVVMNTAPADLVHRILQDQTLLLDRDRSLRIMFEVKMRNDYFDLKPIRDRYRRTNRVA